MEWASAQEWEESLQEFLNQEDFRAECTAKKQQYQAAQYAEEQRYQAAQNAKQAAQDKALSERRFIWYCAPLIGAGTVWFASMFALADSGIKLQSTNDFFLASTISGGIGLIAGGIYQICSGRPQESHEFKNSFRGNKSYNLKKNLMDNIVQKLFLNGYLTTQCRYPTGLKQIGAEKIEQFINSI